MAIAAGKHITEPDKHGFQVRIVRKGVEYSRYFSHRSWGSKDKSFTAAQSWRDQQLVILGKRIKSMVTQNALTNNKTTGVRGVTKTIAFDRRRDMRYLVYQVHWKQKGEVKNRKFQVGKVDKVTADQELHAYRTALHFRKAYELCVLQDLDFDAEWYRDWKKYRLYEEPIELGPIKSASNTANKTEVELVANSSLRGQEQKSISSAA